MISIIVSSVNPQLQQEFRRNIAETIGDEEYEIIAIENARNPRTLAQVYNEGAQKAKYPYLLFMHEDAGFLSKGWAAGIERKLAEPDCGVIGFAGSKIMYDVPGGWGIDPCWNMMNVVENGVKFDVRINDGVCFDEAVTLDGFGIFVRKEVWEKIRFDEKLITGFHCYDVDFSICTALKYKNYICYCVDVFHNSHGKFDEKWMCQTMEMYEKKWRHFLPVTSSDIALSPQEIKKNEERAYFRYIRDINRKGVSLAGHLRYFLRYPWTWRHIEHFVRVIPLVLKSKLINKKLVNNK